MIPDRKFEEWNKTGKTDLHYVRDNMIEDRFSRKDLKETNEYWVRFIKSLGEHLPKTKESKAAIETLTDVRKSLFIKNYNEGFFSVMEKLYKKGLLYID